MERRFTYTEEMIRLREIDDFFIRSMRGGGIPFLRIALGVVFFWFGALKIAGVSPVEDVVRAAYPFFPPDMFMMLLGVWEAGIGLCLIFGAVLRVTLALLWAQLVGTFFALLLAPSLFFQNGNPILLTGMGEFVIKNIVLLASSIVIGGFEVKKSIPQQRI